MIEINGFAIVNGVTTSNEEFPWQVSVRDNVGHLCGGAIIFEKLVLTSAHCVHDNSLGRDKQLRILSGTTDHENEKSGQIHLVKQKIIHEDFNYNKNDNDIAILQLHTPFSFGPTRQRINLPSNEIITNTKGDSGGALTVQLKNYNIIIGIAERYFPDAKSPGPDTYVDVKQYLTVVYPGESVNVLTNDNRQFVMLSSTINNNK
ncbi:transmembrane protease serine 5-like [Aphidius gifuensis]|uniref:transmembrane protease serine 5-like n=1 Tax=Aphidius gifuensis TaxID=684658 RepID=UPI001CDCFB2B|nr:transmembrane protease serine 5-like [Aphidius gifuensis]